MEEGHNVGLASDESHLSHDGAWHFILIRTSPGADRGTVAATLRKNLAAQGLAVLVRDWRGTAGAVALYVYFMQVVLYVGLSMIGGIVLILTINSLVMSVFERTAEIGTMRAIGAQRGFVRGLFVVETTVLSLISGTVGIVLGLAGVSILDIVPLHFSNQILVLLFGGAALHPSVSGSNILLSAVAAVVLGTPLLFRHLPTA